MAPTLPVHPGEPHRRLHTQPGQATTSPQTLCFKSLLSIEIKSFHAQDATAVDAALKSSEFREYLMDVGREEEDDFVLLYQLSSSSGQDLNSVLSAYHIQQTSV